jgi:hypothetical protein
MRFLARQPLGKRNRAFTPQGCLVNIGRKTCVGFNADLPQQIKPSG